MLGWHILETTGALEFYGGKIFDKMAAFDLLRMVESGELMECEKIYIDNAKAADPFSPITVGERENDLPLCLPVEAALWLESFDWELGTANGSLQCLDTAALERFEETQRLYTNSWVEVDLFDLRFELAFIEMLAPNASPPALDLLSVSDTAPKRRQGGPGRRRKHDWDGALMSLIGEAERNSIAADPEAHGAQADIAARLADWFAQRDLPIPANSQLQEKARDVLASIRAANPT